MLTLQADLSIVFLLKVLMVSLLLPACTFVTDSGSVKVDKGGQSSMELRAPDSLLGTRAIVEENLIVEVSILANGSNVAQIVRLERAGEQYTGTFELDTGNTSITFWMLRISWLEIVAGESLLLATHNAILQRDSDRNIVVGSYNTNHDNDNDGQSNLSERINGSDPFTPPMMRPLDDQPVRDINAITPVPGEGQTDCRSPEARTAFIEQVDEIGGRNTFFIDSFILPEENGTNIHRRIEENTRALFGSVFVSEPGDLTITILDPVPPFKFLGLFDTVPGGLNVIDLSPFILPSLTANVNAGIYCYGLINSVDNPFLVEVPIDLQFQPESAR